ncbi:MAG TPA: hypothetical protein VGU21_02180, partial [Streptosporangiaceae bacterium]|nr:hypothetical protein [Streptosporangiaceae bacterium]
SFGVIILVVTLSAPEAGRQVAPAPRVRLGYDERLDRQPPPVRVPAWPGLVGPRPPWPGCPTRHG